MVHSIPATSIAGDPLVAPDEAPRGGGIAARILAPEGLRLFLAVVQAVDLRPLRPRVVGRAGVRRPGQDLQLAHVPGAQPDRGAHAVGSRVATADHHHVLPGSVDRHVCVRPGIEEPARVATQEVHGQVDSAQLAAGDGDVARDRGAGCEHHGVELGQELLGRQVRADRDPGDEPHALVGHELDAPRHDPLVELHVGDAVDEQAADPVRALEDRDEMASLVELRRGREPGRTASHDRDGPSRTGERRVRDDPAVLPGPVGDLLLDRLDRDRVAVDRDGAGPFAGRRADATGELGEVVRAVETDARLAPLPAVDEVVPLRDQVVDRAARGHPRDEGPGVAERDAAVHAARGLLGEGHRVERRVRFLPVADPLQGRAILDRAASELHESGRLAHP